MVASAKPDLVVQKYLASAMFGANLGDWLKSVGSIRLVVVGAVSYQNSMRLLKAKDIHEASCIVLQAGFAVVMMTQEWIDLVGLETPAERSNPHASCQQAHGLA